MGEEDLKNNDSPEDLEWDYDQNEGEEKIKNTKGDKFIKGLLLFTFIFLCIGIIIVVQSEIKDRSDDSNLSGIENIVYRDVQRSDISMTYDMGITSVTVVIQANNDIEEFSGTVQVKSSNGSVIDSERVTYANMRSGSRYEVVFHLSVSQMLEVDSYGIVDISGKVRR